MRAFSPGGSNVTFVGGEEKCAAVGAAHGEELGGAVDARADSAFDIERLRAEQVMLEAVHGAQAMSPVGSTLDCSIFEFRGMSEHQMVCRVSVDSAVFANGVKTGRVGAESHGSDAVGTPRVASWFLCHG